MTAILLLILKFFILFVGSIVFIGFLLLIFSTWICKLEEEERASYDDKESDMVKTEKRKS